MTPITIVDHSVLGPSVSGRELFSLITSSAAIRDTFVDWFRERAKKYGFIENTDYVTETAVVPGRTNRPLLNFILTLKTAKVVANSVTKKRGVGVVAFIEAYEATGVIPVVPGHINPNEENSLFPRLTSQHSEPAPLTEGEIIQELQKLSPETQSNTRGVSDEPIKTTRLYPVDSPEDELTPGQRLLRKAQQLVEEEQRIKAQQEEDRAKACQIPAHIGLSPEQLATFESRIKNAEGRIDTIIYFFQQASHALRGLEPVAPPVEPEEEVTPTPEPTPRNQLILLVNAYAAATLKSQRDTWRYLYGQFSVRKGFNPYTYGPATKDKDYLSIVEKHNHFDALFDLAKQLFVLPELK